MSNEFRYYQTEADNAIYNKLQQSDKCLVKMFCGTGKSKLMRYCKSAQNQPLVVYVFPSLSLIDQFHSDYLSDILTSHKIKISSENESTTDPKLIKAFLKKKISNKIICITYQSFSTLLENLDETKISVCIFDEAHHVVGEKIHTHIFSMTETKQIFFTATPKNDNGITMYDRDRPELNMCGQLVYDYSYLRGMNEGYLNPIEIRIDMYTENTNKSVYESIARSILISGNNRVLTFHADVTGDRDKSVLNFVNKDEFITDFRRVCTNEFPDKQKFYKDIEFIALHADINMKLRKEILKKFDTTPNSKVFIISSCETIGEGIDTKNANMCVFADPKTSFVKIIQNIGRVVRKEFGKPKPPSTILIPCWVDREKYIGCADDKEKRDEVIREDINKEGNFNGILNVLSALKQEDEDIYDICLNYPDAFSPQELNTNADKQGYKMEEPMELENTLEHLLDSEVERDEDEDDEEFLERVAEENDVCIEVHCDSLEEPVKRYGNAENVIRMMKTYDEDEDEELYQPMVKKNGTKRNFDNYEAPKRANRISINVHTNPDVKVLWNVVGEIDLTKDICSCVIDCEVVSYEEKWLQNLEELKSFIDINKRRPVCYDRHNKNTEYLKENYIAEWVNGNQKCFKNKAGGMKNNSRYNLWKTFLEDYFIYYATNYEKWDIYLENLKKFININKKRPNKESSDINEKKLGTWTTNQVKNHKDKLQLMKDKSIYDKWTNFIEEYAEYFVSDNDKWKCNLLDADIYITNNKSKPIYSSYLGHWIVDNKQCYINKTWIDKERYNLWETFIQKHYEYFMSPEELWESNFNKLLLFINNNNKTPSNKSKDIEEKNIGTWFSGQKTAYKNKDQGMKDKYRYEKWSLFVEQYSEYLLTEIEIWYLNFNKLVMFINNNNKLPNKRSENNNEKQLGYWLGTQKRHYKDKSRKMKEQEIFEKWEKFLQEYAEYFETTKPKQNIQPPEPEYPPLEEYNYQPPEPDHPLPDNELEPAEQHQHKTYNAERKPIKSMKLNMQHEPKESNETPEQQYTRNKSELSILHQHYKTLKSTNLGQKFQSNPEEWYHYHRISEINEQTFPEDGIPRNRIIQALSKIITNRSYRVVDMGCGKAQICQYFACDKRFEFYNYDHVSCAPYIDVCDISQIPLESNTIDICILSLAMWGSNCEDYLKEAHRILDRKGELFIIEATKRWTDDVAIPAGRLHKLLLDSEFEILKSNIEKFAYFHCIKV